MEASNDRQAIEEILALSSKLRPESHSELIRALLHKWKETLDLSRPDLESTAWLTAALEPESRFRSDISEFYGVLRRDTDGLEWQRSIRAEWEG